MPLTGKQKRVLRSMGQTMDPVVFIGKEGVGEQSTAVVEDAFRRRELIKVRVMRYAPAETADIAAELATATNSEMAGKVGNTFLLYRPNPSLKERVELPPAKEAGGNEK